MTYYNVGDILVTIKIHKLWSNINGFASEPEIAEKGQIYVVVAEYPHGFKLLGQKANNIVPGHTKRIVLRNILKLSNLRLRNKDEI